MPYLLSIFTNVPNWSQLRSTPMSFLPSRSDSNSFSTESPVGHRCPLSTLALRGAHSLSVRSSSCAAVVNIWGGSCGTGGGPDGMPGGPASWIFRFSMCSFVKAVRCGMWLDEVYQAMDVGCGCHESSRRCLMFTSSRGFRIRSSSSIAMASITLLPTHNTSRDGMC